MLLISYHKLHVVCFIIFVSCVICYILYFIVYVSNQAKKNMRELEISFTNTETSKIK